MAIDCLLIGGFVGVSFMPTKIEFNSIDRCTVFISVSALLKFIFICWNLPGHCLQPPPLPKPKEPKPPQPKAQPKPNAAKKAKKGKRKGRKKWRKKGKRMCVFYHVSTWWCWMIFDDDIWWWYLMVHDGIWLYLIILWLIWLHFDGSWS